MSNLVDPREDGASFENVMAAIDEAEITDEAKVKMYEERRFGVDGDVGASTSEAASDKEDWEVSMNRMRELCRDGGLVFLPAKNTNVDGGLIGQVPAGADIELRDYETKIDGRDEDITMKTLELHRVREVHPDDGTGVYDDINWGHHTVHNIDAHRDRVVDAYRELY